MAKFEENFGPMHIYLFLFFKVILDKIVEIRQIQKIETN